MTVLQDFAKNDLDEPRWQAEPLCVRTSLFDERGFTLGIEEGQTECSFLCKKVRHDRSTAREKLHDRMIDLVDNDT
jgi:hypothetical protein